MPEPSAPARYRTEPHPDRPGRRHHPRLRSPGNRRGSGASISCVDTLRTQRAAACPADQRHRRMRREHDRRHAREPARHRAHAVGGHASRDHAGHGPGTSAARTVPVVVQCLESVAGAFGRGVVHRRSARGRIPRPGRMRRPRVSVQPSANDCASRRPTNIRNCAVFELDPALVASSRQRLHHGRGIVTRSGPDHPDIRERDRDQS